MRALAHLVEMGKKGYVMNNSFETLITDTNLARLKDIPIFLFSGSENVVFSPESTTSSYFKLSSFFANGKYDRVEFAGRGHLDCWMGEDATRDVYPAVKTHIEEVIARGGERYCVISMK